MTRRCQLAVLLALLCAPNVQAQSWAQKLFTTTSHDFGTVARGAKAEFAFEMTNPFLEEVHIAGVRSSCGCTSPSIVKSTLKTYEKGAILAKFNTRSFLGKKSATVTVTIDRPFFAEVQINVAGYIRSDVVFSPGAVAFTDVAEGAAAEQIINVSYAGRSDWRIVDVRSNNSALEVELSEPRHAPGQVLYAMTVRLKPNAPAGYLREQLLLVTNDRRMTQIPLTVEGKIVSAFTVSPASLFLGVLKPGESVSKQLVVRGKKPFRILDVNCQNDCFEFTTTDESKKLHLVPLKFTAGQNPAKIVETITIRTDAGSVLSCIATATVVPLEAKLLEN